MKGFITTRDVLAHPVAIARGFGLAVRFARLREAALQGVLLSTLSLLVHHEQTLRPVLLMAVGTTLIKAVVIPWMLRGPT
jgi:hydrogenase-4 membrane subunit HyfE